MLYVSPKKGGGTDKIFFLIIYPFIYFILILVPLYRRKFCDGHVILVFIRKILNSVSQNDIFVICVHDASKTAETDCNKIWNGF